MKKESIINAISFLKEQSEKITKLSAYGVNLIEFDELYYKHLINIISESINEDENVEIKDWIEWWLYEDVDKIIYCDNQLDVDVNKIEDFIDYIFKNYKKNA